jgi:5-methylphenazine-1-carboxylate 1-monooxygenase
MPGRWSRRVVRDGVGPVLVVGGGIGGLTAALALHQVGVPVQVFESVRAIRALGVGINLLPHATRVLSRLMLTGPLGESAIETAELVYYNRHGQRIWGEPRGRLAGYDYPQFSVHRGELQMILLRAVESRLGRHAIRTGHHLDSFTDTGDAVEARFVDRDTGDLVAEVRGAALVGADGIHSVVRRLLYPDEGPARYAGRTLWRALAESAPFLGGRTMIMAGHQAQKFVAYPVSQPHFERGRSLTNWVAELDTGAEARSPQDWSREAERGPVRAAFAGWRFGWLDVPALIDGAATVYEYPLVDRDPLPQWSFGRVTLLGDAAHPMYPIGSNGASQAILDAETLADRLAGADSVEAALGGYDAARRPASSALVLANRENGPEQVMQLAEERAPGGFADVHDVIPHAELETIASRYKRTAGFAPEQVNRPRAR